MRRDIYYLKDDLLERGQVEEEIDQGKKRTNVKDKEEKEKENANNGTTDKEEKEGIWRHSTLMSLIDAALSFI